MKRFLVFSGMIYYPSWGWRDFKGAFDTQAEAEAFAIDKLTADLWSDWVQVVDLDIYQVVFERRERDDEDDVHSD